MLRSSGKGLILVAFALGLAGCNAAAAPAPTTLNRGEQANVRAIEVALTKATARIASGNADKLCRTGTFGLSTRRFKSKYTVTIAPKDCVVALAGFGANVVLNGKPSISFTVTFSGQGAGTAIGPSGKFEAQLPHFFGLIVSCSFPAPRTRPVTTTFSDYGAKGSLTAGAYVCDGDTYKSPAMTWP